MNHSRADHQSLMCLVTFIAFTSFILSFFFVGNLRLGIAGIKAQRIKKEIESKEKEREREREEGK